jgi:hypothetical protein
MSIRTAHSLFVVTTLNCSNGTDLYDPLPVRDWLTCRPRVVPPYRTDMRTRKQVRRAAFRGAEEGDRGVVHRDAERELVVRHVLRTPHLARQEVVTTLALLRIGRSGYRRSLFSAGERTLDVPERELNLVATVAERAPARRELPVLEAHGECCQLRGRFRAGVGWWNGPPERAVRGAGVDLPVHVLGS